MREILGFIKDFLIVFTIIVLIIVIMSAVLLPLFRLECNNLTEDIGLDHRWSFFGGCQVLEDENWIPLGNWRYFGNP